VTFYARIITYSAKRRASASIRSTLGTIASTSGPLCGGGMGYAPTRITGPFNSEKRFSWIVAASSAVSPPTIDPSEKVLFQRVDPSSKKSCGFRRIVI